MTKYEIYVLREFAIKTLSLAFTEFVTQFYGVSISINSIQENRQSTIFRSEGLLNINFILANCVNKRLIVIPTLYFKSCKSGIIARIIGYSINTSRLDEI